jgi:hypothetical protein
MYIVFILIIPSKINNNTLFKTLFNNCMVMLKSQTFWLLYYYWQGFASDKIIIMFQLKFKKKVAKLTFKTRQLVTNGFSIDRFHCRTQQLVTKGFSLDRFHCRTQQLVTKGFCLDRFHCRTQQLVTKEFSLDRFHCRTQQLVTNGFSLDRFHCRTQHLVTKAFSSETCLNWTPLWPTVVFYS